MDKSLTAKQHHLTVLKISITVGLCLAITKFVAGIKTNSMAIMASALDSAMDMTVSLVNFIAYREATKPPDHEHAYGHGKIESLAGLFQSSVIGVSAIYFVYEAIKRLIAGSYLQNISTGIGVMVVSLFATLGLVIILKQASKKQPSIIIDSEKLHFVSDLLSGLGVIVALVLVKITNFIFWDLLLSVVVAFYILKASIEIFRKSVDELIDRGLPEATRAEIRKIIMGHDPSIVGIHNLRSRRVGQKIFLDFHIEIRGEDDFKRAHQISESLIDEIRLKFKHADVTVHCDPEGED